MLKTIIIFNFLFTLQNITYSQLINFENLCSFKSNGLGKSRGVKSNLSYPCNWKLSDGDLPDIVKTMTYKANNFTITEALTVIPLGGNPTTKEIDMLLSTKELKSMCEDLGTYISAQKINLNSRDAGEIIYRKYLSSKKLYATIIQYIIFYKDVSINVSIGVLSENANISKQIFFENLVSFKKLGLRFSIY